MGQPHTTLERSTLTLKSRAIFCAVVLIGNGVNIFLVSPLALASSNLWVKVAHVMFSATLFLLSLINVFVNRFTLYSMVANRSTPRDRIGGN